MSEEFTILGYSERGAVNALFYDIAHSDKALRLLEKFLALADFSVFEKLGGELTNAEVLIEQSLSDFGDADAILLLEAGQAKSVVYIEAKVKSFQAKSWTLARELEKFKKGSEPEHKLSSSNLFAQLYHKYNFNECLRMDEGIMALKIGIDFPECSTKGVRKIGENGIVMKAVEKIKPFSGSGWYLAIVPDNPTEVCEYFKERRVSGDFVLKKGDLLFGSRCFGMAWEKVEAYSLENSLRNLNRVLSFNGKQIYEKVTPKP